MKLSKQKLKQIIKEELSQVLSENAERAEMEEIARFLEKEYEGATIKVRKPQEAAKEVNWLTSCNMEEPPPLV